MKKGNVLGVPIACAEYDEIVDSVAAAAHARQPMCVSALAVHGVIEGVRDDRFRGILNGFDLICPDGQPVRWALRFIEDYFGAARGACDDVVAALSLQPLLGKRIGELSKGQRKRALLGIGLLSSRPVLMADEPFEGLDLRQTQVSVIAFFSTARPVVVDTFDAEVVTNILQDLPLEQAFQSGKTTMYAAVAAAGEIGASWRANSATLVLVSDGDTLPPEKPTPLPPAFGDVLVLGVSVEPGTGLFNLPVTFANGVKGNSRGVELSSIHQITPSWRLRAGYTWLRKDLSLKPGSQDTNRATAESDDPDHQFQLQSSFTLPGRVELDLTGRYVDELTMRPVPAYTQLDVRLAWRPTPSLELSVVGQNLLDPSHPEFVPSSPSPREIERSLYGKVAWRY